MIAKHIKGEKWIMKKIIFVVFVIAIFIITIVWGLFLNRDSVFDNSIWEKCIANNIYGNKGLIIDENNNISVFYTSDDCMKHCVQYDINGNKVLEKVLDDEPQYVMLLVKDLENGIGISSSALLEGNIFKVHWKIYDYSLNQKESYTFETNASWLRYNSIDNITYCLLADERIIKEFSNNQVKDISINYSNEQKEELQDYYMIQCINADDGFVICEYNDKIEKYITYKVDINGTLEWYMDNESNIAYEPLLCENDECILMVWGKNNDDNADDKIIKVNNQGIITDSSDLLNKYFQFNNDTHEILLIDDKYLMEKEDKQFKHDYFIISNDLKEFSKLDLGIYIKYISSITKDGENYKILASDANWTDVMGYVVTDNMFNIISYSPLIPNKEYHISNVACQDDGTIYILTSSEGELVLSKLKK